MEIVFHLAILCFSIAFLIKGSEWLLKGAVVIAEKLKISRLAIASTLIAFGTGLPSISASLASVLMGGGGQDAAVGIVLGTNFVNMGLALGIPAFMLAIVAKYQLFEKEIPFFLAITGLYMAFALDGKLSPFEGIMLILAYLVVLFVMYQYAIREKEQDSAVEELDIDNSTINKVETSGLSMKKSVLYIVLGLLSLLVFSFILAGLNPFLSKDLGISEYVLGLTLIGIGTSLPTIVTSIRSAKKGYVDIILGNVLGGTIANIALGLGIPSLFKELSFNAESLSDTYYFAIFNFVVLTLILIEMKVLGKHGTLSRLSGIVIVGIYLVYLGSKLF